MNRTATAVWNGTIKEGSGYITTQSTLLNKAPYSFNSLFTDGIGTNPEELMAAAHAGCFAMQLSLDLSLAGFTPAFLETSCTISLETANITSLHLTLKASIPGLTNEQFKEYTEEAKDNCPMTKICKLVVSLDATLIQ